MSVGRLLFVREYLHARHELAGTGRDQHKIELMFRCELQSEPREAPASDTDQESAEWVRLDRMPEIQIFPTALGRLPELAARAPAQADGDPYWGDVY